MKMNVKKNEGRRNNSTVNIAITTAVIFSVLASLIYIYLNDPSKPDFFPCLTYNYLGIYCAGCGSSRAIHQLLHGNFVLAFRYNPLMLLSMLFFLYAGAKIQINRLLGRTPPRFFATSASVYTALIILVLYTVLRNLPIFPLTLLAPPDFK